jgi:Protein of unknown function (DUF2840)
MRKVKAFNLQARGARLLQPSPTPNMRVAIAHVEGKVDIRLRFGRPLQEQRLDRWRSLSAFAPGAICCTVRWFGTDCGGPSWQLLVLRAPEHHDTASRIEGVAPRAQVLLRATGERDVQQVLAMIGCIDQSGVDPCILPAAYWRRVSTQIKRSSPAPTAATQASADVRPPRRSR